MKKNIITALSVLIAAVLLLTSCGRNKPANSITDDIEESHIGKTVESEKTAIPDTLPENINTLSVKCAYGTDNCWSFTENKLTFENIGADTLCSISGEFDGQIVIDAGESNKFELELCGITLFSLEQNPIYISSGKKVTVTAKKDSKNFIYDIREKIDENDKLSVSSAIYSKCDLNLEGKGELVVISKNNNGIQTKDCLSLKNTTVSVFCEENALKGNDEVFISGGVSTFIAKSGNGIKSSNNDASKNGNQHGNITVSGGTVNVYSGGDGIDSANDVAIGEEAVVKIYTDEFSPYSVKKEVNNDKSLYIRSETDEYAYSVKCTDTDGNVRWNNAALFRNVSNGGKAYYYYSFDKPTENEEVQVFVYSAEQTLGQEKEFVLTFDSVKWNNSTDTFAIDGSNKYSWTNYALTASDGFGTMSDGKGKTLKESVSAKGIKAANEISILGGNVTVNSYDDALFTEEVSLLDSGLTSTGNIVIVNGTVKLYSESNGIHSNGDITVNGGKIYITKSYEGLEGTHVTVNGGEISVVSTDDGINSTVDNGTGIALNGGTLNITAGGDGIDTNSETEYEGIVFSGCDAVIISTSNMNTAIDNICGYSFRGGTVLAICRANGTGNESGNCVNFNEIGTKTTVILEKDKKLAVNVNGKTVKEIAISQDMSAMAVYLGAANAEFEVK